MDHEGGRCIADDVLQFGDGEPRIQREEYRADPSAGELHFQRIRRVQREHGDPVAALDAVLLAQMRGEPRDPRIKLRVAEPALAGEVDYRRLVRGSAAEMGDPVIIAHGRHAFPRSGRDPIALVGKRLFAAK